MDVPLARVHTVDLLDCPLTAIGYLFEIEKLLKCTMSCHLNELGQQLQLIVTFCNLLNFLEYCGIERHRKTSSDIRRQRNTLEDIERHHKTSKYIKQLRKTSKDIKRYRKTSKDIKKHQKTSKLKFSKLYLKTILVFEKTILPIVCDRYFKKSLRSGCYIHIGPSIAPKSTS